VPGVVSSILASYRQVTVEAGRRDRVVVEIACVATPAQSALVVGEFQRFVASFQVRSGEQAAS
jgi:hypothetical protein